MSDFHRPLPPSPRRGLLTRSQPLRRAGLAFAMATTLAAAGGAQGPATPPPHPVPTYRGPSQVVTPPPWATRAANAAPAAAVVTKSARVEVAIQDGIATTTLRQVLHNQGSAVAEADWVLPLPGAAASRFTMTMNGQEVAGEVLDAGKARGIYERIVRRMRDPGLLEYAGEGCLRARVFPIPAGGEVTVTVRYAQVLEEVGGLHRYHFPLRALAASGQAPQSLAADVQIVSRRPLKSMFTPLDGVDTSRSDDHHGRASFESANGKMPARDLELFYGVDPKAFGIDVLCHRAEGADRGHLLLMLTPRHEWADPENTVRVVQFVMDTSGSMQGEKIAQARDALRFFVRSLRPTDRFNVVPFSTEARPFFANPVAAGDEQALADAERKIDALEARGGTNIEEALSYALGHAVPKELPEGAHIVPITVFLTDGLPTLGETHMDKLLASVAEHDAADARVFVFGVGNDVNTSLLDRIAEDHRGDRDYVRPGENIEVKTSALFTKLSHPVLTDVELLFDGQDVQDLEPRRLSDLFRGSRLLLTGRYDGTGPKAIRLRGKVNGEQKEFVYETTFPANDTRFDFVPLLWAKRRVGTLLDGIRLNGANQELVAEIQQLGREFGLVTPYTSHLIVEENQQLGNWRGRGALPPGAIQSRLRDAVRLGAFEDDAAAPVTDAEELEEAIVTIGRAARERLRELPEAEASGEEAVDRSLALLRLRTAGPADVVPSAGPTGGGGGGYGGRRAQLARLTVQRVGGRVLHLVGGVWVDRGFRKEMRGKERRIEAWSPEWFELSRKHPELGKVLAFSTRLVLVLDGGEAIEVVEPAD